jgi:hypothetical protein
MIFWGGLLCVFDISFSQTTNGNGFTFDILNDALGTILIAVGVFRLAAIGVHSRYTNVMGFVQIVSILAVLNAIRAQFITPLPDAVQIALNLFAVITLVAIVAFCVAMRWFSEEADLPEATRSWSVTVTLFVVIYLVPLGSLYIMGAVAIASGTTFNIELGPAGLLLLAVFAIPLIHLFVSTSRMKRAAEARGVLGAAQK